MLGLNLVYVSEKAVPEQGLFRGGVITEHGSGYNTSKNMYTTPTLSRYIVIRYRSILPLWEKQNVQQNLA